MWHYFSVCLHPAAKMPMIRPPRQNLPRISKAPVSEGDEGDDEPTSVYPIPGQPESPFYLPLHEPLLAALALDYNEYPVRQEMETYRVHIKWTL